MKMGKNKQKNTYMRHLPNLNEDWQKNNTEDDKNNPESPFLMT